MKYTKYILFNPKTSEFPKPKSIPAESVVNLNNADQLLDNNKFAEALTVYSDLLTRINCNREHKLFVYLKYNQGLCYKRLALLTDGQANLLKAITVLQEALQANSNKEPLEYAIIQNDLGSVYLELAEYQEKETHKLMASTSFKEAQTFFEKGLKNYNYKQHPMEYVLAVANLSNTYNSLAGLSDYELNLEKTVITCESALGFLTSELYPSIYALIQFNLGYAYDLLAATKNTEENRSKAVACYQTALKTYNASNYPIEFVHTQNALANVYIDYSLVQDPEGNLNLAINACKEALNVFNSIFKYPLGYALILHNLGSICKILSNTRNKEANLSKALHYFEEVLQVEGLPHYSELHASTHLNLGIIYSRISEDRARSGNLTRAISAFEETIRIYNAEDYPIKYAITQTELGNTSQALAKLLNQEEYYLKAIRAFEAVVIIFNQETYPLDYAKTQFKLGTAYLDFAKIKGQAENLAKAIAAFEAALKIFTLADGQTVDSTLAQTNRGEANAILFATIQNSYGEANTSLAEIEKTDECYNRAITSFENALKVYTAEKYPQEHANTQLNLGLVCQNFAKLRNKENNLTKATRAIQAALKVLPVSRYPQEFATAQVNLARILMDMAEVRDRDHYLKKAQQVLEEVLKVYDKRESPSKYCETLSIMGNVYIALSDFLEPDDCLKKAFTAFDEALQFYTVDRFPQDFAINMNNVGITYKLMAEIVNNFTFKTMEELAHYRVDKLSNAIGAFHGALSIFTKEQYPLDYAMVQNNLGTVFGLLAEIQDKQVNLTNALNAYQEALQFYTPEASPANYHKVKVNVDRIKQRLVM